MRKWILLVLLGSPLASADFSGGGLTDYYGNGITSQTSSSQQALDVWVNNPLSCSVSGSVNVTQGTSPWVVSGTVNVGNFPSTYPVTQSTSPWVVSGTVAATQSGTWTVQQGSPPWSVSQSGTWNTGRTWTLSNATDSVASVQSGTWNTGRTWTLASGTDSVTAIQGTSPWVISGTVTSNQGTSPWVTNVSQFGGSNVVTGTGASGSGIPRVTVSNDSNILATQSGAWSVTANAGTNLNTSALALDTTVSGLQVAQGSTTSGQKGALTLGAVTTAAPSYTTGQSSPLSLTTAGALRVDGSATTQPISAASLPLPTGASTAANQTTLGSQTTKLNDGTNTATVKAASTAPVTGDTALVVALHPSSAVIVGSTVSINQTTPGTTNGVVVNSSALPTGAATAANQSTEITSLSSIDTRLTNVVADSSTANIANGANFTSTCIDTLQYGDIGIAVYSDRVLTQNINWYTDAACATTAIPDGDTYSITASSPKFTSYQRGFRYFKVVVANGSGSATTTLAISVTLSKFHTRPSARRAGGTVNDDTDQEDVRAVVSGKTEAGTYVNVGGTDWNAHKAATNGIYNGTTNTQPSNSGVVVQTRNSSQSLTRQGVQVTGIQGSSPNADTYSMDIALHDETGTRYATTNPLAIKVSDGTDVAEVNSGSADGQAGSQTGMLTNSRNYIYNGTWDRWQTPNQIGSNVTGPNLFAAGVGNYGQYNATAPTLTDTRYGINQLDINGNLRVNTTSDSCDRLFSRKPRNTEQFLYDVPASVASSNLYLGLNTDSTSTGSATWTVVRFVFDANGNPTEGRCRQNVAWTSRTSGW